VVLAISLALLVLRCSLVSLDPPAEARGGCTLDVVDLGGRVLERPYVVEMDPVSGQGPTVHIRYGGSGWSGLVAIRTTRPSREDAGTNEVEAAHLNDARVSSSFDEPGLWQVEVEDHVSCLQRLEIEVLPPGGVAP
jgi:hypothetical protein